MRTIFRKELADHFSSTRVFILFLLVYFAAAVGLYATQQGIRGIVSANDAFVFVRLFTTPGQIISLTFFITILVPVIGIAFGFDAINREYISGTMSRIASQPMYRDSIITGKFLAGLVTIYIMMLALVLIVSGAGLAMIGVPPSPEEIIRIAIWLFYTVAYGAFWLSLAVLFSVLFRRVATSLLTCLALWLFFTFFVGMIAGGIANSVVPESARTTIEAAQQFESVQRGIMRVSPVFIYSDVTSELLEPTLRSLGLVTIYTLPTQRMLLNPLSLGQSLLAVWPHLTIMLSLTLVCFAISYIAFMRQEIRAT